MKNHKKTSGQLLIESLIGVSIVVVGLLGIVGLVSRSLSLNRVVSDQFTASYLSLEGIEIARNLLDSNIINGDAWNAGFENNNPNVSYEVDYDSNLLENSGGRYLRINDNGFYNYNQGRTTAFKRTINVDNRVDDGEVVVNSIVKWSSRGGEYEINNEHHFYDWRPR
jgi:Tfp pilus assembly protein PilV